MWAAPDVMSRFIEAADTETRSPSKGMQQAKTCWPAYRFDNEDRKGWTDDVQLEEQQRWAETKGAKADAVSRYNEVVEWGITYLASKDVRRIVWTWAFCQVKVGKHFTTECRRNGWAKATAYRRLTAAFEAICFNLNNDRVLLRVSALNWLRQKNEFELEIGSGSGSCVSDYRTPPAFISERSTDLLQTPEAVADFAKALERRNARMRKIQAWRNEGAA